MATRKFTGPVANSTLVLADVDAGGGDTLSFPMLANTTYWFRFVIVYKTAATTTGISLTLNGPASPTYFGALRAIETAANALNTTNAINAYNAEDVATAVHTADTPMFAMMQGACVNGANAGDMIARFRSEVDTSAVTILESYVEYIDVDAEVAAGRAYKLGSDCSVLGTALANVQGGASDTLKFACAADKWYRFSFHYLWWSDLSSTGINLALNGPTSPDAFGISELTTTGGGGFGVTGYAAIAYDTANAVAARSGSGTMYSFQEGYIKTSVGNAGDLVARMSSEGAGTTSTVRAGSFVFFQEMTMPSAADCPNEGGFYLAETAAHFANIGLPTPTHWHLYQGTGPNIDDEQTAASDADLVPSTTMEYEESVAGYTRDWVQMTETSDEGFSMGDPFSVAGGSASSVVVAVLINVESVTGVTRGVLALGTAANPLSLQITTAGIARISVNGVVATGQYNYEADGLGHLWILEWDIRGSGAARLTTDRERIEGTYSASVVDSTDKRIGGLAGIHLSPQANYGWDAIWVDAEPVLDLLPICMLVTP